MFALLSATTASAAPMSYDAFRASFVNTNAIVPRCIPFIAQTCDTCDSIANGDLWNFCNGPVGAIETKKCRGPLCEYNSETGEWEGDLLPGQKGGFKCAECEEYEVIDGQTCQEVADILEDLPDCNQLIYIGAPTCDNPEGVCTYNPDTGLWEGEIEDGEILGYACTDPVGGQTTSTTSTTSTTTTTTTTTSSGREDCNDCVPFVVDPRQSCDRVARRAERFICGRPLETIGLFDCDSNTCVYDQACGWVGELPEDVAFGGFRCAECQLYELPADATCETVGITLEMECENFKSGDYILSSISSGPACLTEDQFCQYNPVSGVWEGELPAEGVPIGYTCSKAGDETTTTTTTTTTAIPPAQCRSYRVLPFATCQNVNVIASTLICDTPVGFIGDVSCEESTCLYNPETDSWEGELTVGDLGGYECAQCIGYTVQDGDSCELLGDVSFNTYCTQAFDDDRVTNAILPAGCSISTPAFCERVNGEWVGTLPEVGTQIGFTCATAVHTL